MIRQTPAVVPTSAAIEHLAVEANIDPNLASQMRVAFSSMDWNTGANSPGDELMTLQHLRRGGLLLQRLPQFVEQPRVLDGDDGLGGEILHQFDLLVGERPDLAAVNADHSDQRVFLEHRHVQRWSALRQLDNRRRQDRTPVCRRSAMCSRAFRMMRLRLAAPAEWRSPASSSRELRVIGWGVMHCATRETPPSCSISVPNLASQIRVAFASMALKHRLQFAGRRADDSQHLAGRRLLLQASVRSSCAGAIR